MSVVAGGAGPEPQLTLVVVIHDSGPELTRLLGSLDRHLAAPAQVVVVDNASSDDGAGQARKWGAEVIEMPGNAGFGAANNAGLARARAPVSALVNPDVELLDSGLHGLAALAAERERLVVPRLVGPDGGAQRSAHPAPGTLRALLPAVFPPALMPRPLRLAAEPWRSRAPRRVGWAIAACLVAQTRTLQRLGPFDPSLFLFYEDMDLCLRARAAGISTALHPGVALRHSGGHSTGRRYGGEPHAEMARRRREVVLRNLGPGALRLDDAAQGLTFATRAAARALLDRDREREREQLRAWRAARSADARGPSR